MPMDENEKKELVKKIMEQRKAMWKGEAMSERPRRHTQPKPEESTIRHQVSTSSSQSPISDLKSQISRSGVWGRLAGELRKSGELSWKTIFFVIIVIVGAIMLGVLIGYLTSTMELMRKLGL